MIYFSRKFENLEMFGKITKDMLPTIVMETDDRRNAEMVSMTNTVEQLVLHLTNLKLVIIYKNFFFYRNTSNIFLQNQTLDWKNSLSLLI